jgi:hypothetical protein
MPIRSVLTGDIVNSTQLSPSQERKITSTLLHLFKEAGCLLDFYRGDSFQAYVKHPQDALRLALLSRTAVIRLFSNDKIILSDIRISIGIGAVKQPIRSLKTAKGAALILSGRAFDTLSRNGQRLAITSHNPLANQGLEIMTAYLNSIFDGMTGKQAAVIFEILKGEMQIDVAKKFKKTRSTIHQRLVSGRWQELANLLQHYENIIKLLI